jgi:acetate kinase
VILAVNGGSSSIKFAAFDTDKPTDGPVRTFAGAIDRIGSPGTVLTVDGEREAFEAADHGKAADHLLDFLSRRLKGKNIAGVGHRIVHGGLDLCEHQIIDAEVIQKLKAAEPLDMDHLPREIALIERFQLQMKDTPQIACFDSAFHRDLPRVAKLLPIPRRFTNAGVRRLGFHGLSYAFLMERLRQLAGDAAADGRIILAHLGAGASLAAVHQCKPIDTSMSFTPTAGLVMATRCGDLDPGVLIYLARSEKMNPGQLDDLVNRESGLLGVSETSADMRDLVARRANDPRAADAVALFCYQARKWIGAFAAALGGVDTLVFSAGIGEHGAEVRAEICQGLQFLGLRVDPARNAASAPVISEDNAPAMIRVIPTDEESMIARIVQRLIGAQPHK